MNANRVILAAIVALAAAGLLALAMSGGNTGPTLDEVKRGRPEPVAAAPRERKPTPLPDPVLKKLGPDGQSMAETLKSIRAEGLPERPPEGGPLDEGTWESVRREADETWHEGMMEGAEHWAAKNGYDRSERQELVSQVARFSKRVITVRDNMRAGRLEPDAGRDELENLRMEMTAQMITMLGKDGSEELRQFLGEATAGGGW